MGEGPEVVSGAFAFLSFFLKIFFFFFNVDHFFLKVLFVQLLWVFMAALAFL